MTYRLEFELEGLPPTTNGSHGNHFAAAAVRKKWRTASKLKSISKRPSTPLKKCKITATRFSSSEMDYDNLVISFKSVIDGLRDAGIILDDKKTVVIQREYLQGKASPGNGKIQIIVEEV